MLVKTVDGRPIKIEGHPDHPLNRGRTDAAMQASVLSLYDPDRLKAPHHGDREISWVDADESVISALAEAGSVVLLTRSTLRPSERALIKQLVKRVRGTRHFVYESFHDGLRRSVWKRVTGKDGEILPVFDNAKVILSIDSDFLGTDGAVLENALRFARSRNLLDQDARQAEMSRLYVAEASVTVTGSNADHRFPIRPSATLEFVQALRSAIQGNGDPLISFADKNHANIREMEALVRDLQSSRGKALIVAGPQLPESVHAAVLLLNTELDAPGKTLSWNPSPANLAVTDRSEIRSRLESGVDVLITMGVNPVYDWPDGDFLDLIQKAGLSIGHGLYADETNSACHLALPSSHNLESWNDASPRPGLFSLCQPVIASLYQARQEAESLFTWIKGLGTDDPLVQDCRDWHDYLRRHWLSRVYPDDPESESRWEDSLRSGLVDRPEKTVFPNMDKGVAESIARATPEQAGPYEITILPDPALFDGRFANNAWLQELPAPVSTLVWDNAAVISPETASGMDVREGDRILVRRGDTSVEIPVLIQPGVAEDVISLMLGYGRTEAGSVGNRVGVNVSPLLGSGITSWVQPAIEVSKTDRTHRLVRTQKHVSMEGRPLVIHGTLSEYRKEPDFVLGKRHQPKTKSIYEPFDYSKGHKWFMAIDLTACTGCGACTIACQAENNIPVVGKTECAMGREMHWIRIDRYMTGDGGSPIFHHQPLACQHCDNAPCENVCPVNATTHSAEGLNQMVYNRCVGTRYCSNNCPYKVRRFNFFDYQKRQLKAPEQELVFNPQVTVRSRGVMEKCTFCIQRINEAKYKAKNVGKPIPDGTLQTACQQACPAGAIVFGDINDPDSAVNRWRESKLAYPLLEELNTEPSLVYLAKVTNRHPDVPDDEDIGGHG
jgi:molybdopterin-containing oxidoreductase family iron-sulfur binding subunit